MNFRWLLPPQKTQQHKEWEKHLTPERRAAFGVVGDDAVKHRVARSDYADGDALSAAKAWLAEKQRGKDIRKFYLFWAVILSLVASLIGIIVSL